MSELFPFFTGPVGRNIVVDASGRLVTTGEAGTDLKPFGFGQFGRVCVVDSSGRLVISPDSPGISEGNVLARDFVNLVSASGIVVNLSSSNNFFLDINHDATLTLNNPVDGARYLFIVRQATGNNTITFPVSVKWKGGTEVVLTAASGSIDVITICYYEDLDFYVADFGSDFE